MSDKEDCIYRLRIGMFIRFIVTIFLIIHIKKYYYESEYILLILVGKLLITDAIDSIFTLFYKGNLKDCWNPCTGLHYYQSMDKVLDLLTYILIYFFLDCNPIIGVLIVWRFIGVFLFSQTKNRKWLVPFFDFIKEYLVYLHFFGKNNTYLPFFILAKIGFEYYLHVYRLSNSRCLKFDNSD